MLQALIPISEEVSIPYTYHRYIIGEKGKKVRELMDKCNVHINIPKMDLKSDIITVSLFLVYCVCFIELYVFAFIVN